MDRTTTEDKLFNFRPAFFTGAFLSLGIGLYYLHAVYGVSVWWSLLLLLTATPLCFCQTLARAKKILLSTVVLAVVFFAGFFSLMIAWRSYTNAPVLDEPCEVTGTVVEKVETEDVFYVVLDNISMDGKAYQGRLIAYLPMPYAHDFALAHTISVTGEVYALKNDGLQECVAHMGGDLRYRTYAQDYGVGERTFDMFLWARERVRNVLYAGMADESASVMIAILTGDTTGIDVGLLENIRYGGIAHIFAVSGLHVGALYGFCLAIFSKTRMKKSPKLVRFFTVASLLILYGSVCGFSPSIVRATVMCLSFYFCRLWLYGSDSLERVGLAGTCVLLFSPTALFEAGFQLSFCACLGIVLLVRPISAVCNGIANKIVKPRADADDHPRGIGRRIFQFCVSLFAVSASAQLSTAPLLLHTFGYLSGWSLLLNVLFVPLISALFSVLLLLTAFACLLPLSAASYVLYVPSVIWSVLLLFFHAVDLSRFAFTGIKPSVISMYFYGFACTFLTDKWNVSKGMRIFLFCVLFFCFVFSCFFL